MLSIMKEEHSPRAPLHEERHQGGVGLGCITVATGEDQIVRPIVGGLTAPGPDMVQGNGVFAGLGPAIRVNRAVLGEQPFTMRLHGTTGGKTETGDRNCGMSSRSACHKIPS